MVSMQPIERGYVMVKILESRIASLSGGANRIGDKLLNRLAPKKTASAACATSLTSSMCPGGVQGGGMSCSYCFISSQCYKQYIHYFDHGGRYCYCCSGCNYGSSCPGNCAGCS